ncbi:FoF1 ATP synthase subunit a [Nonomuraea sp. NPDC050680]|uniref:F0F1 ATP synthase subunit A n=1 Tax=Nonomuraea sp. NPDC050680 TaxID=3154630 RepID=UPI0033C2D04A
MRTTILITSDEFKAPGTELFDFDPIIPGGPEWLTKPTLLALLSSIVVIALCWGAFAKPRLVPRDWQNLGEYAYVFVREQVAKPNLGKDADRWMGLLLTIFLTVLVWNLMGVIPFIQFPVAAHIDFPLGLAISVYVVKVYLGVKHHGVRGYGLTVLGAGIGVLGVAMTMVMTAFEMFIQFLQAFLFALLAAMFIASGLKGSH